MSRGGQNEQATPPQAGDATGVERLYRHYAAWLSRALTRRMKTTAIEVDDLVQETYLRIARYPADEAERHPKALLMRIAVNLARDNMRRSVVRGGRDTSPVEFDKTVDTVGVPPEQEGLLELKRVVLRLPPLYRDVFVLSRFTGLTYEEIASHVGVSVKTVEWRMSKALALCAAWVRD